MFGEGHRKKEGPAIIFSLAISNRGFDLVNFIIEAKTKRCKQLTWVIEEEGKVFTIAIGGSLGESRIESKSKSLISFYSFKL